MYQEYRSAKTLSRIAMAGVGLVGLCTVISAFIGIAQIMRPDQTFDLDGTDATSVWLLLQGLVTLIQFPLYILAVVIYLVWLHRVYVNLPALRSDHTEYTPGWAVGWWFIPFANLVKPFQVVRNAWSESDPDFDPQMGFLSSVQAGAPAFMAIWWAFWLLSNISANISAQVYDPEDIRTVEVSGYLFIVTGILTPIAAGFAIKVIAEITDRQEQRFRNIGTAQQQQPPPPPIFDQNV
jgi:hypothetical protein